MKLKQYNLGSWFGALRYHAARTMFYAGLISLMLNGAAAIRTIQEWFSWVTYPMLMGTVFILVLVAMILEHMFVYKAEVDYISHQAFIKENPQAEALLDLLKRTKRIEEYILGDKDEPDKRS